MKTTIEIGDDVLARAKQQARRERKTLREIVDEALRQRLAAPVPGSFQLRKHPFKGEGRHATMAEGQWENVRDLIYPLG